MNLNFLKTNLILFSVPIFIVIIDQLSKRLIFSILFIEMKVIQINFFFNLSPVWNNGISFGMFNDSGQLGRYFFTVFGLLFGLLIPIITKSWSKFERIGAGFIAGGAIGNALDRIIYGRVIDFIDLHFNNIHFPTFNFADTFITLGVILMLISSYIKR
tara:strand:+ start:187 stop:660 length:474 start_codon:yes stop_codon:yes gene_type:complete